ncbi:unnamed protein product [Clavelina lepadiformis]|uniref:Uncharacterized protein n=1 Tax=Clavelina lepadiformis TaxID=159417 RepID=A0ABP0G064_CLALP
MSKLLYIFFTHQDKVHWTSQQTASLYREQGLLQPRNDTRRRDRSFFYLRHARECDTSVSLCLMFCISSETVYRYLLYLPKSVIVLYQILVLTNVMNIVTTEIILSS